MDAVHQEVGPDRPVRLRAHLQLVPGAAFEAGPSAGQRDQAELPAPAAHRAVEVGRVQMQVGAPFLHRRRLRGDVEGEPPRSVPGSDRLHEGSSGEFAPAHCPDAGAGDPRAHGVRDAQAEEPLRRRGQLGEPEHVGPHLLGRGIDLGRRDHLAQRRAAQGPVQSGRRGKGKSNGERGARGQVLGADRAAGERSEHPERQGERKDHPEAESALHREEERGECRDRDGERADGRGRAPPLEPPPVEEPSGRRAHREWRPEEHRGAVAVEEQDVQADGHGCDQHPGRDAEDGGAEPIGAFPGWLVHASRTRRSDREQEHQDPVHIGQEEEQCDPGRKTRVQRAPQGHAHADPEEGQRPRSHPDQQPLRPRLKQRPARGQHRRHVVERRPDLTRRQAHGEDVHPELQRHQRRAVQQIGAPVDALLEAEPEAEQPAHRCSVAKSQPSCRLDTPGAST